MYFWLFVLLAGGLTLAVTAPKEERLSEEENRILSGFPELTGERLLSGEFFTGIESYLSDGMFGRDSVVGMSEGLLRMFSCTTLEDDTLLEEREIAAEVTGSADDPELPELNPETYHAFVTHETQASEKPFSITDTMEGAGFWLETRSGRYVSLVSVRSENIRHVADVLNAVGGLLPADGRVFYTNVPRAATAAMLTDSLDYVGWQESTGEHMTPLLGEGVHYVSAPELLEEGLLAGEKLYFSSDHHWTPRGAMYVAQECIRLQGLPAVGYDEYSYRINYFVNEKKNTKDELPLLYTLQPAQGKAELAGGKGGSVPLIIYDSGSYSAYLGGDTSGVCSYTTGFSTGRNALVVGDSYSNCFLPYLLPCYDRVSKADIRHFDPEAMGYDLAALVEREKIDDVYIIVTHLNGVSAEASCVRLPQLFGLE